MLHIRRKIIISDKVRDHCLVTGKYTGPAHQSCNINVTQKQSVFILFIFHKFSNYGCHLFFKKLIDKKNKRLKFDFKPKTKEVYKSAINGFIRFIVG